MLLSSPSDALTLHDKEGPDPGGAHPLSYERVVGKPPVEHIDIVSW